MASCGINCATLCGTSITQPNSDVNLDSKFWALWNFYIHSIKFLLINWESLSNVTREMLYTLSTTFLEQILDSTFLFVATSEIKKKVILMMDSD